MSGVVVIGLDSLSPDLLFERFKPDMPNTRALMEEGRWGVLRTCHPPITIPAWAVMFTGMDPGSLGLYGIHHRSPGSYFGIYVPTPKNIRHPPIWSHLSAEGKRVAVVGVPPAYPPPAVNGIATGDFLTPDGAADAVFPSGMQKELEKALGEKLMFDVLFRQEDRATTLDGIVKLSRQRWTLAREIYKRGPWELFAVHDIGPDRIHHAFLKFFDPSHPRYSKGNQFEQSVHSYYRMIDEEIGKLLKMLDPKTAVLVVSDHGTQAMQGCFAINEWLVRNGYLSLKGKPRRGASLEKSEVDWSRSRVWATGGYYSRINFNVRGREPLGIVSPQDVDKLTEELRERLGAVKKPNGELLGVKLLKPQEIYREVVGDAPDLMAYFGDVSWRAAGTMGHESLFLEENDTGPDDAVHGWEGVYLLRNPSMGRKGKGPEQKLIDVAPTLLALMGRKPMPHMQGKVIGDWLGGSD
jgi:predicted AlkP superfamily phosphohydrolase/phosphomutase